MKQSEKILQESFNTWYSNPPKVSGEKVKKIDFNSSDGSHGYFQTLNTDFEGKKIIIKELPEMVGKTLKEVGEYIQEKGWTPVGHEYWNRFIETTTNPKDWTYYFMFGSLFRDSSGDWIVPYVHGGRSGFNRNGGWLVRDWHGDARVVLVSDENLPVELIESSAGIDSLASLALRVKNLEDWRKRISEPN